MQYQISKEAIVFEKQNLSELQLNVLTSFIEQGIAHEIDNNIQMKWEDLLVLEDDILRIFHLPPQYKGDLYLKQINQKTCDNNFRISYGYYEGNKEIFPKREGAILFYDDSLFLLSIPQYNAIEALDKHEKIKQKTEEDNLYLIYSLKNAVKQGLKLNLQHFQNFEFVVPQKVTLKIEKNANGDLFITPSFGNSENPSEVRSRLHNIEKNVNAQSLRINKNIIILDKKQREAVKELAKVMTVDSSKAIDFLKNPSSFIDSNKVDLEHGFSSRVIGISTFKLAYFGNQEKSGISWFDERIDGENGNKIEYIHDFADIGEYVESEEDIKELKNIISDALACDAQTIEYSQEVFDVSNKKYVDEVLMDIENGDYKHVTKKEKSTKKLVLKIKQNDDNLDYEELNEKSKELYQGKIDSSSYKLQFHPHQNIGIRWILGFAERALNKNSTTGCLLADDMGLGKTFMSLVALREYLRLLQKKHKQRKPVLVVAPVSLLENWKDELEKCYVEPFFKKVILLTATGDLKSYIQENGSKELVYSKSTKEEELKLKDIRYSLKVGSKFKDSERLDNPENIVLTNYDTLRAYSASLAMVKWSEIIFDEIQMIKNPNTFTSNAAKALQADFKLAVTGTPVENSLKDIWNIFDVVNSGLLGEYQKFRSEYISPIIKGDIEEKNRIGQLLRQKIGLSMLRREKSECAKSLPKKNIYKGNHNNCEGDSQYDSQLDIVMNQNQLQMYKDAIADYQHAANKRSIALKVLQKLRYISLCPMLLDNSIDFEKIGPNTLLESSEKLKAVKATLDNIRARKEKVIIFLINKKLQLMLQQALQKIYNLKIHIINGDIGSVDTTTVKSRKSLIKDFESKEGFNIIIMSPIAAGVGLTIIGANNVIHLERHWNPAKEAQATDRVYRLGQTKDVNIYIPISKLLKGQSFDEHMDTLLSQKINLNKSIVTPSVISEEEFAAEVLDS